MADLTPPRGEFLNGCHFVAPYHDRLAPLNPSCSIRTAEHPDHTSPRSCATNGKSPVDSPGLAPFLPVQWALGPHRRPGLPPRLLPLSRIGPLLGIDHVGDIVEREA